MVNPINGRSQNRGSKGYAFCLVVLVATIGAPGCERATGREAAATVLRSEPRIATITTGPLTIDRIYHSMQGPTDRVPVDASELDWVTAIRTDVIDHQNQGRMGDEFFCHSNLELPDGTALATMATGVDELRFPKGFAIPLSAIAASRPDAERPLNFVGMVLNNHEPDLDKQAEMRASIEYFKDSDFGTGDRPKKLYMSTLVMQVEDLAEYTPGKDEPPINPDVTTHCALVPLGGGVRLPLHWMVPPGRQMTRNRYEDFTATDGTVHFAWAHLHNYGVYVRLTDVTEGEVLFQADVENEPDRDQIANITRYRSAEGFKIYRDHVYEIEALYDNTTDEAVDAMAMMTLYYNPEGNRTIEVQKPAPIRVLR